MTPQQAAVPRRDCARESRPNNFHPPPRRCAVPSKARHILPRARAMQSIPPPTQRTRPTDSTIAMRARCRRTTARHVRGNAAKAPTRCAANLHQPQRNRPRPRRPRGLATRTTFYRRPQSRTRQVRAAACVRCQSTPQSPFSFCTRFRRGRTRPRSP
ncbi:MAG: hypothetical protein HDKAJFGB_00767 [Anaerolineae bacterium]|nr:hypothetical protein [Anaerolineae bacterium]